MVPKLIDSLMEPFIGLANIFEVPVANHCSKHWEYNSDKWQYSNQGSSLMEILLSK